MKKIFITGISGFVGSHLADLFISQNQWEVHGTYLSEKSLVNLKQSKDSITLHQLDLLNQEKTLQVISEVRPDYVYHLAALPAVGDSYNKPLETIVNNIGAEISLLEAIRKNEFTPRILVVTSADIYGKVDPRYIPISENTPFNPTNTYAVSKLAQDFLGLQYVNSYAMDIVRARPFNHIGPRQAQGFVVGDFCKKIVDIEKGNQEPILQVGNLDSKRDFTDVRDIVVAYSLLLEKGIMGEVYNIGRGKSYKIKDILEILIGFSSVKIQIKTDESLLRAEDAPERVCDVRKFHELSGWEAKIAIEKTLKDTLDYWRHID